MRRSTPPHMKIVEEKGTGYFCILDPQLGALRQSQAAAIEQFGHQLWVPDSCAMTR
jgi:hypothetical protein